MANTIKIKREWYIITKSLEIVEKCRNKVYAEIQAKRLSADYYERLRVVHEELYAELKLSPPKKDEIENDPYQYI